MPESSLEVLKKYQKTLSFAGMGLWELDITTNILSWDEGFRILYNLGKGEYSCEKEEWYKRVLAEDRPAIGKNFKDVMLNDSEIDIKFRASTNLNELKFIRSRGYKIKKNNKVVKLVGIQWDVTTESLLKNELTKAKEFTENILNAIPDPLFVKNQEHEVIYVNSEYEKLVGKKKEEIIGKNDYGFFPKELADICWKNDADVFKNNTPNENEEMVIDSEGRVRNILTKKTPVSLSKTEKILLGVIRDITDLKNIQHSLLNQSKMASIGEMAAEIAHEVNNPLMIIQGKSQLLIEKINSKNVNMLNCKKDLEQIEKNCDRITKIIKTLKSITRKSDSDPFEKVSILKLIDEAFELSRDRFRKKKLNLFIISNDKIDYSFKTNARPSEVVQVLVNLLNNSYDAIQDQVSGWARIKLSLQKDNNFLIEITDSGPEISPAVAKSIMEPFFSTKATGEGTGLGLSISKQIIEAHKGELSYDSSSPDTRFIFTLPKL